MWHLFTCNFTLQEYTPLDSCCGSGQSAFTKGRQHMVPSIYFVCLFFWFPWPSFPKAQIKHDWWLLHFYIPPAQWRQKIFDALSEWNSCFEIPVEGCRQGLNCINLYPQILDNITLTNLDIVPNGLDTTSEGTLLERLDHCSTPFGRDIYYLLIITLFYHWLLAITLNSTMQTLLTVPATAGKGWLRMRIMQVILWLRYGSAILLRPFCL